MTETVETSKKISGYLDVAEDLKEKISQGVYLPGKRLPTVRELAAQYGIGVETASRGVQVLKKADILNARPGSGIFVCEPAEEKHLAEILTFVRMPSSDNGQSPYSEYIETFSSSRLHGIQDEAVSSRIRNQVVLIPSAAFGDADKLLAHIQPHLASQQGGIVINAGISAQIARKLRDALPFPLCFTGVSLDGSSGVNVVRVDHYRATRRIVDYLADSGHRRIACIGANPNSPDFFHFEQRQKAYRHALKAREIDYNPDIVWETDSNFLEPIEEACRQLLSLPDSKRPSSVFCFNDFRALALLRIAREMGVDIPGDISVASFDGTPQAMAEGITTVHFPTYQVGMMTMMTLKAIALGGAPQPMVTTIEGGSLLGRTVKCI